MFIKELQNFHCFMESLTEMWKEMRKQHGAWAWEFTRQGILVELKEGKESIDKRKFWLIEDEIQVESIQLLKKFTKDDPNFGG